MPHQNKRCTGFPAWLCKPCGWIMAVAGYGVLKKFEEPSKAPFYFLNSPNFFNFARRSIYKTYLVCMKKIIYLALLVLLVKCGTSKNATSDARTAAALKSYYTLRVYHLANADQMALLDQFLETAYLPALHRQGIATVGVFKPVDNDTASDKKVVVFTPYTSLQQLQKTSQQLQQDITLEQNSPAYVNAPHNSPPFTRFETILLEAFDQMPGMALPQLQSPKAQRIYELRSYEGATEKLYQNKVQMFNEGGEVPLFRRLNFNAVFYAAVLAGARMPNLMYLTTFENRDDREAHWKTFGDDPEWKKLSSMKEYQNNVSKADIWLMAPTAYSDF